MNMIFADKLIQLRKKAGWSQEELAFKMDVTRQSVSKWEGAQSIPDLDKMIRLFDLFGVSLDYLLKDETHKKQTRRQRLNPKFHNSIDSGIQGVIKEVADGGMVIGKKSGEKEIVNLDFVTRIREYPRNKNGKKKIIFD